MKFQKYPWTVLWGSPPNLWFTLNNKNTSFYSSNCPLFLHMSFTQYKSHTNTYNLNNVVSRFWYWKSSSKCPPSASIDNNLLWPTPLASSLHPNNISLRFPLEIKPALTVKCLSFRRKMATADASSSLMWAFLI